MMFFLKADRPLVGPHTQARMADRRADTSPRPDEVRRVLASKLTGTLVVRSIPRCTPPSGEETG